MAVFEGIVPRAILIPSRRQDLAIADICCRVIHSNQTKGERYENAMYQSSKSILRRAQRLCLWRQEGGQQRNQSRGVEDVGSHDADTDPFGAGAALPAAESGRQWQTTPSSDPRPLCMNLLCTSSSTAMARRDRTASPDTPNKRVRPSHRSPRSPSPTRRSTQRASTNQRSRYDDDREWDRDRYRERDRDRDRDRERDRYRDDRYRDDRRGPSHRDPIRDDRRDDRRRSRSRERRPASPPRHQVAPTAPTPATEAKATPTPPPEDEKLRAKRAKFEAWKKEREAKKALDEAKAKAKAMALAGKSTSGAWFFAHTSTSLTSQRLIHLQRRLLRPRRQLRSTVQP